MDSLDRMLMSCDAPIFDESSVSVLSPGMDSSRKDETGNQRGAALFGLGILMTLG